MFIYRAAFEKTLQSTIEEVTLTGNPESAYAGWPNIVGQCHKTHNGNQVDSVCRSETPFSAYQ